MWVDFLEEATLRPGGRWTSDPGSRATAFREDTAGTDRRGHVAGVGCAGAARELRRVPRGAHPHPPARTGSLCWWWHRARHRAGRAPWKARRAECCQGARCERQASWPPRSVRVGAASGGSLAAQADSRVGGTGSVSQHPRRSHPRGAFPCCVTSGEWLRCSSPPFLVFPWKYQCLSHEVVMRIGQVNMWKVWETVPGTARVIYKPFHGGLRSRIFS